MSRLHYNGVGKGGGVEGIGGCEKSSKKKWKGGNERHKTPEH